MLDFLNVTGSEVTFIEPPKLVFTTYCTLNIAALIINVIQFNILRAVPKVVGLENFFFFIRNLAVFDALMGLLRASLSNKEVQNYMVKEKWLCILSATLSHCFLLNMSCLLLLVSIDRVVALRRGANYSKMKFVIHFRKITYSTMALIFLLYATIGAIFSEHGYEVKGLGACKLGSKSLPSLGILSVGTNVINLAIIVSIYVYVLVLSRRLLTAVNKKSMKNIILTIGLILAAKIFFWCPIMVAVIMRGMIQCTMCDWIGLLTMSLNSIANPLLYGLTNSAYRKFISRILKTSPNMTSVLI